jgi:hypothetical protein
VGEYQQWLRGREAALPRTQFQCATLVAPAPSYEDVHGSAGIPARRAIIRAIQRGLIK